MIANPETLQLSPVEDSERAALGPKELDALAEFERDFSGEGLPEAIIKVAELVEREALAEARGFDPYEDDVIHQIEGQVATGEITVNHGDILSSARGEAVRLVGSLAPVLRKTIQFDTETRLPVADVEVVLQPREQTLALDDNRPPIGSDAWLRDKARTLEITISDVVDRFRHNGGAMMRAYEISTTGPIPLSAIGD